MRTRTFSLCQASFFFFVALNFLPCQPQEVRAPTKGPKPEKFPVYRPLVNLHEAAMQTVGRDGPRYPDEGFLYRVRTCRAPDRVSPAATHSARPTTPHSSDCDLGYAVLTLANNFAMNSAIPLLLESLQRIPQPAVLVDGSPSTATLAHHTTVVGGSDSSLNSCRRLVQRFRHICAVDTRSGLNDDEARLPDWRAVAFGLAKLKYIVNALTTNTAILYVDADVVFLRDPFPYLLALPADIAVATAPAPCGSKPTLWSEEEAAREEHERLAEQEREHRAQAANATAVGTGATGQGALGLGTVTSSGMIEHGGAVASAVAAVGGVGPGAVVSGSAESGKASGGTALGSEAQGGAGAAAVATGAAGAGATDQAAAGANSTASVEQQLHASYRRQALEAAAATAASGSEEEEEEASVLYSTGMTFYRSTPGVLRCVYSLLLDLAHLAQANTTDDHDGGSGGSGGSSATVREQERFAAFMPMCAGALGLGLQELPAAQYVTTCGNAAGRGQQVDDAERAAAVMVHVTGPEGTSLGGRVARMRRWLGPGQV